MKKTRIFRLERPARKSGGDRYEELVPKGAKPIMNQTYVDQSMSREVDNLPEEFLKITVEHSAPPTEEYYQG